MHNLDLILTLAAGFAAALTFGYITHRLGLSPIVGYLLSGLLVGPHTPGFVADKQLADQLAEVGVILLMFGVGLHFHLKDLLAVRRVAITGALGQILIATALGAVAAHAFGWAWTDGIVFGLALSVASTVVLTRVLSDNGQLQSPTGRIAIGWLVMEDIFTVFVLVLLPAAFSASPQEEPSGLLVAFVVAVLKLTVFTAFILLAGSRLVPRLLNKIADTHSRELFTLSVLAIALGIAVSAAILFDISMALGAFLAGMVVGQSDFGARAAAEALPMRDAFAVMFFLSIGMLLDPAQILSAPLLTLLTLVIVMIGKPLAAFAIVALLGYGSRIAFGVAIALAQIGEFSFLVATLSRQLGVLPETAMNPLVASAIVSIMFNPLLYRAVRPAESFLSRHPRLWRLFNPRRDSAPSERHGRPRVSAHHAIVVGYGPIGQTVVRLLGERGIQPTIIEMNIDTHRSLRSEGFSAVHGDATRNEVLEEAGVLNAASLILTASGAENSVDAIRVARQLNPRIHVVARADFLAQTDFMQHAGAAEVFSGEGEVALAITDSILRRLGATPDQLDEEHARIRAELAIAPKPERPRTGDIVTSP